MDRETDRTQIGRDQWRRYRSATQQPDDGEEPGAMQLAAYADCALGPRDRAQVERWLARNPDRLADILAARRAGRERPRAKARAFWRDRASWGAAACALMLTAWMGFDLGQASVATETIGDSDTALIVAVIDEPGI
ncbi:hypothetical protein ACFSM5_04855 [Lacibacterium aquatile]|uniref:Anti-sigma factor n=1 Tax=Lacibacterium aquatile TaxID=1168082 RepID=A0ABW5DM97_9PROT